MAFSFSVGYKDLGDEMDSYIVELEGSFLAFEVAV